MLEIQRDNFSPKNLLDRITSPTGSFWKKVRNIMLGVGTISGAILAAPVVLPTALITVAGYGVAVGAVGASLAQLTKQGSQEEVK